jgi:hypothetical protein
MAYIPVWKRECRTLSGRLLEYIRLECGVVPVAAMVDVHTRFLKICCDLEGQTLFQADRLPIDVHAISFESFRHP